MTRYFLPRGLTTVLPSLQVFLSTLNILICLKCFYVRERQQNEVIQDLVFTCYPAAMGSLQNISDVHFLPRLRNEYTLALQSGCSQKTLRVALGEMQARRYSLSSFGCRCFSGRSQRCCLHVLREAPSQHRRSRPGGGSRAC